MRVEADEVPDLEQVEVVAGNEDWLEPELVEFDVRRDDWGHGRGADGDHWNWPFDAEQADVVAEDMVLWYRKALDLAIYEIADGPFAAQPADTDENVKKGEEMSLDNACRGGGRRETSSTQRRRRRKFRGSRTRRTSSKATGHGLSTTSGCSTSSFETGLAAGACIRTSYGVR